MKKKIEQNIDIKEKNYEKYKNMRVYDITGKQQDYDKMYWKENIYNKQTRKLDKYKIKMSSTISWYNHKTLILENIRIWLLEESTLDKTTRKKN